MEKQGTDYEMDWKANNGLERPDTCVGKVGGSNPLAPTEKVQFQIYSFLI